MDTNVATIIIALLGCTLSFLLGSMYGASKVVASINNHIQARQRAKNVQDLYPK